MKFKFKYNILILYLIKWENSIFIGFIIYLFFFFFFFFFFLKIIKNIYINIKQLYIDSLHIIDNKDIVT